MQRHRLKSWPEFFCSLESGIRSAEIRRNDRKYRAGDVIVFCDFDPNTAKFSGKEVTRRITYVMDGVGAGSIPPLHGLSRDYCILSLEQVGE